MKSGGDWFSRDRAEATLSGRGYAMLDEIGKGSYAFCFAVRSLRYEREFVAKIQRVVQTNTAIEDEEIGALLGLNHPNIIRMYEHFRDECHSYTIIDRCSCSLRDVIRKKESLASQNVRVQLRRLVSALRHCHDRGIAHRDIKPENILVDYHGRMIVADFGLSTHYKGNGFTKDRVGSKPYMSPEMMNSTSSRIPSAADMWSLGVTVFEMLTGKLPWASSSNGASLAMRITLGFVDFAPLAEVDADLVTVVRGMLDPSPTARMTAAGVEAVIGTKPVNAPMHGGKLMTRYASTGVFVIPHAEPGRIPTVATMMQVRDGPMPLTAQRTVKAFMVNKSMIHRVSRARTKTVTFLAHSKGSEEPDHDKDQEHEQEHEHGQDREHA